MCGSVSSIYIYCIYMEWDFPVTAGNCESKHGEHGGPELRRFQFPCAVFTWQGKSGKYLGLKSSITCEFLDVLYSRIFYPLITCPTRITAHTAMDNHLKGGILFSDISDHLPVFSICFKNLQNVEMNRTVTIHHKNINNMNKFKERLADTNWS